jgi:Carboxypeptidase regulatory-like domain
MRGEIMKKSFLIIWVIFIITGCNKTDLNEPFFYSSIQSEIPPSPGRANVKGTVLSQLDDSPIGNVEVWLCTEVSGNFLLSFNCKGKSGQTRTDQNGVYWFRNLPPGKYGIAIKSPREKNKFYTLIISKGMKPGESAPMTLTANQTIEVAPQKIDPAFSDFPNLGESSIKLTNPIMGATIQERKPTLSWEQFGRANKYKVNIYRKEGTDSPALDVNLDKTKEKFVYTKNTNITPPDDLPNGIYIWTVSAFKDDKNLGESNEGFFIVGEIPF